MTDFDTANWRIGKIKTLEEAAEIATKLKNEGKKIVTVNGSFDILHAGHLDQLEEAKKQGDILFVGINSDTSVRQKKGEKRPYLPQEARAAMLAALECVDYLVIIDAAYDEVQNVLIRAVKPNIHTNGPDYGPLETWIEWPIMQEVGAKGHVIKRRNDLSTSALIDKIRENV